MRKNGFIFTHLLSSNMSSTTPKRVATISPYARCCLVVCKIYGRKQWQPAWCARIFAGSLCACALGLARLLKIDKPPAGRQQAIVQPYHYNKPPAGRLMAMASLVQSSLAQVGAQRNSYPKYSVLHLRCVINISCLLAVSMEWLRRNSISDFSNDPSVENPRRMFMDSGPNVVLR